MMNPGKLTVTAAGDREIRMTRTFDAPRRMVFDAWTKPELLKRWLGVFEGWSMAVCEVDLRVGGGYRFVWRHTGGAEMGMRGTYLEVVAAERLKSTEVFDDRWYEGDAVGTLTFDERDGRTTVTNAVMYASREARDGVLKSPMEHGVSAGYDKLAELLATPEAFGGAAEPAS